MNTFLTPKVQRLASKALHLFTALVMVLNVTTAGFLVNPQVASATTTTYFCSASGNPLYMWDRTPSTGWSHGNISGYFEGDYIPVAMELNGLTAGVSTTVRVEHQYIRNSVVGIQTLDHTNAPAEAGVTFNADRLNFSLSAPTTVPGNPSLKRYNLTFTPTGTTASLYLDALLGPNAHLYSGSSLHVSMPDCGSKDVPINVNQILYHALSVAKSDNPDPILINTNTTYTVTATNNGKTDGGEKNFTITDTLPAGMTYVLGSATPAPTSVVGQVITWNFGTVADGASKTVTYQAKGTVVGTHTNTATISADGATPVTDTEPTTVYGTCNLVVTKSADKTTAVPGNVITYTITYENQGSAFCTGGGVKMYDELHGGLTYVANSAKLISLENNADVNGGTPDAVEIFANTFNGNTNKLLGNLHEIGPGEKGVIELKTTVNSGAQCSEWDVWNSGWTDGIEVQSDVTFQSQKTNITTPCYGSIQVNKKIDVNGNGTFVNDNPSNYGFMWGVDGGVNNLAMGSSQGSLSIGNHDVNENSITGYHFVGWYTNGGVAAQFSCTNPQGTTLPVTVAVSANVTTSITLCNARDTGRFTFDKIVIGGTAKDGDFTFTTNGNQYHDGDSASFPTGSYPVTESGSDGYTLTNATGACSLDQQGNVTLNVTGQGGTCTITNTRDTGTLIVTKHVINDNGGAKVATDFTMQVSGNNPSQTSFAGNESGTAVTLETGAYSADEDAVVGYAKTLGQDCSGSISVGETKYCTITNDDIAPKLTLIKNPINDNGGNAQPNDFNLSIGGAATLSGEPMTVEANTPYVINETSVSGYTFVSITGDEKCPTYLGGSITLDEGDDITCTITNDDIAPKLTLIKNPINDNGGNAQPNDFNLSIGGTPALSGTAYAINSNTPYAIDEVQLPGYTFVSITGDKRCPAVLGGSISLNEGEDVTCTITNDDQTAHLTLIKYVTNDDGGLATPSDWLLSATGPTPLSDYGTADADVNTGTYTLSENGPTGYTASDWTCRGGNQDEDTITLALGESATCTITNDDIAGKIWGYKFNDNNGNGQYDQDDQAIEGWTIFLKQAGQTIGTVQTNSNGYYEFTNLLVGDYSVVENMLTGWAPVSLDSYDFSVVPGYTHQFDFLNYQLGKISGYKFEDVDGNGTWDQGEPAIAGWTINLSGSATDTQNTDANGYYEFTNLAIGTYTVSEEMQAGWDNTTPDSIAGLQIQNSDTNLTKNTFGNFKLGKISGYKFEDLNGNGTWDQGEPALDGWEICIDEEEECVITGSGEWPTGYYEFTGLAADTYSLSEDIQDGWVQMAAPSDVVVTSGTNSTDNNFGNTELSTITATKLIDADGDLESDEDQTVKEGWTVQLWKGDVQFGTDQLTDVNGQYTWDDLMPGMYTVKEIFDGTEYTALTNTEFDVQIVSGDDKTVTFVNFENIDVTVCKFVDLNGNGDLDGDSLYTAGWDIFLNQTEATTDDKGCYTYTNLGPGSYDVSEASREGWMQTYPESGDYEFDAVSGQNVRYDFGNFELGKISGYKFEDINRNGEWDENEGGLSGWTINLWDDADGQPDEIIDSTVTDENGYYQFSNLKSGAYYLSETLTDGWVQTYPVAPGIHGPIVVTSGYDNNQQEEYFLFGNAEKITLNVDKTTDKAVVEATETVNYRIDWSLAGNSIATNVTLVDTIPAQLNINVASISNGGVWDATARTITWNFGDQQPSAAGFVTYTATIVIPIANGTQIINVARLSADNSDPLFDEDNAVVTVTSAPKLTIDKSVNVTTFVNPNTVVTYTVVIDNVGTDTALSTMLADALPAGFTFVDGGLATKTWNLGNVAPADAPITITYQVKIGAGVAKGFYDNLAVTWASNHPSISDKATVEVRVPTVLAEEADPVLIIQKSVNKEFINPGDKVTYTVKVTNIGDAQAEAVAINVRVQDVLPAGFTFEDGTLTKVFQLGDILHGQSKTITYTAVSSKSVVPGDYENVAIAWADNHGQVSDFATVEVRKPVVLGAEALPTTGGSMLVWLYGLVALTLLAFAGWVLRLTFDRNEN